MPAPAPPSKTQYRIIGGTSPFECQLHRKFVTLIFDLVFRRIMVMENSKGTDIKIDTCPLDLFLMIIGRVCWGAGFSRDTLLIV